jgi:GNAT superfamily N-acetyltransferase
MYRVAAIFHVIGTRFACGPVCHHTARWQNAHIRAKRSRTGGQLPVECMRARKVQGGGYVDDPGPRFRAAGLDDAPSVAALHAESWRRHYRGAYSDAFLDNDVARYLLPLWTGRLAAPDPRARTILAERHGEVVGLAHTLLGEDAKWGAFLDNLHVAYGMKRQGIGTRLLALTAQAVLDWSPSSGLYLWVLEQNSDARAFYAAQGGTCSERDDVPPPGGDPARLNGRPMGLRYTWRNPSVLLAAHPLRPHA